MNKTIKQIDFDEAFKLAQNGDKVYVLAFNQTGAPSVKSLKRMTINDAVESRDKCIFFVVEEV